MTARSLRPRLCPAPSSVRTLALTLALVVGLCACGATGTAERDTDGDQDATDTRPSHAPATTQTIDYGTEFDQVLDLTIPDALNPEAPLIVMVHGGGWVEGTRGEMAWMAPHFTDAGFPVANIDYRLIEEDTSLPVTVTFAEQLADIESAIDASLDALGDTRPVSLIGGSAGGHLVLLYGALHPEHLQSIVALAPITDVSDPLQWPTAFLPTYSAIGAGGDDASSLIAASPALLTTPDYPPTLFVHGTADDVVPYAQSVDMVNTLTEQGVDTSLIPLTDKRHFDNWDYDAVAADALAWFVNHSA